MIRTESIKMLSDLSNSFGISGFEDDVNKVIKDYGKGLGEFKEDTIRNLYLYRQGNIEGKPVIQLNGHTDEVGFMVQSIKSNGTLGIIPIGGWVVNNIPAHKVWVKNALGDYIIGIIASKPPHYTSEAERKSALDIKDITVDIGARTRDEAIKEFKIRIGEPIVPCADFEYNEKHDLMVGKAFDNRLGCGAIIDVLKELKDENLSLNLVGDFSTQEEVGTRGAIISTRKINPDISIVFEGVPADDTILNQDDSQTSIKKGPMLRHIDSRMITNPRFQRFALDIGKKHGINIQEAVRTGGATNGAAIHISNLGIPTIVIGVPVRYPHTHYGISTYYDYEEAVKLGVAIIKELNEEIINSF